MPDIQTTIDTHLAGYAEPDRQRRQDQLTAAWTADGVLIDPPLEGSGIDAIIGCAEAVVANYPGHRFVRSSGIDTHHNISRYGWQLQDADNNPVLEGTDIAETDDNGRLVRIVGFFGPLPELGQPDA